MKTNQVLGLVLLVIGVSLLYFGYHDYHALGSRLSRAFSGNPSDRAMVMLVGGGLSVLVGAILTFSSKA